MFVAAKASAQMQGAFVAHPITACGRSKFLRQPSGADALASQSPQRHRDAKARHMSVKAVHRAQSPSRSHALDRVSVPEAASLVSAHPDAVKRRQEAEKRRQSRQQYVQATTSGKGWWEVHNPTNMHLITSPDEFKQRVRLAKGENTLVVVDYFAPWCHACRSLHPQLQKLASNYQDVTFLSVNAGIDTLKAMCDEIGITKLPYFHFLKGEKGIVAEFAANLTVQKLQQLRMQISQHHAS